MKLRDYDRHGQPVAEQWALVDYEDDDEGEYPADFPKGDWHVHVCNRGACPCEFVCDDDNCKLDAHGYGEDLYGCAGCDEPLRYAQGVR